jgi:hypothetical protein
MAVDPFVQNPLGGLLGARTASFYKLDPTGTAPVESIADLVPAFSPRRVVLDMVDSEDVELSFEVTTNALQDFRSATSNVHKALDRMTLSGTLVSSVDLALIGSVGTGGIPGIGGGLRADLLRLGSRRTGERTRAGDGSHPAPLVSASVHRIDRAVLDPRHRR